MKNKTVKSFIFGAFLSLFFSNELLAAPKITVPKSIKDGVPFFLKVEDNTPFSMSLIWRGKKYKVTPKKQNNKQVAISMLALPVDSKSGTYTLSVIVNGVQRRYALKSTKRNYLTQNLNVQPSYVVPPQKEMNKIKQDSAERNRILSTNSLPRMWSEKSWVRPASGILTSPFGARRIYNGQPRNPHSALDFRAAIGDPIVSTATGRVIFSGNHYFTGNTIYIDHGQGVISGYAHLSALKVKKGDIVKAGQQIGLAGATGRVTGPHLHFTLYSYGVAVDPTILVVPQNK